MSLDLAALPMCIWSGCGAFDPKPLLPNAVGQGEKFSKRK